MYVDPDPIALFEGPTVSESPEREQRLLQALRLSLTSGIGPRIQQALLERFDAPQGVLAATAAQLQSVPGVGPKLAHELCKQAGSNDAEREWARCQELGIRVLLRDEDDYPRLLQEVCDPPAVLYCRGQMEPQDELAVGIVGARRCTLYGKQQAERLASGLARAGMTVVSGLARGIDGAAHRGALEAGGRTIAVAATGLAMVYPPEHEELAGQISRAGAVLSEARLDQKPVAGLFPQRNRIISGLCAGVIVVEASLRSGALHTARHAMEQGREVFAVPGRIDSLASEGCHNLIRDGVCLIRSVDDVLESLGPLAAPVKQQGGREIHSPRELTLNDQERRVLDAVPTEPGHIDEVLRSADIDSSRVLATLTVLEMKRMIRRLPGGYLVRATN